MDYIKALIKEPVQCQYAICKKIGIWRRQNTNYCEDICNWACLCEEHQLDADEYWKEMWRELYNNIL